jgi:hypothetical protein
LLLTTGAEFLEDRVAEVVGDDVGVGDGEVQPEGFLDVGLVVDGQVCVCVGVCVCI